MKIRESGMPAQHRWETYFEADAVLDRLGLAPGSGDVVDFGSGYGTFALAAAARVTGTVHAFDLEAEMIAVARRHAQARGLANLRLEQRDFLADGTGLADACTDFAMLFHIVHHEEPLALFREARRVLKAGATLAVLHWKHDEETPRGPPLSMRPRPADLIALARSAGFEPADRPIALPPHHYGLRFTAC
ncbi:MAG: class I SAM-dependent methyltransferase [Pseudomonadota bacterium]